MLLFTYFCFLGVYESEFSILSFPNRNQIWYWAKAARTLEIYHHSYCNASEATR